MATKCACWTSAPAASCAAVPMSSAPATSGCSRSLPSAALRRVEAVTGEGALALVQQQEMQLRQVADAVKAQPQEAAARVAQILDNVKMLEKELALLKSKLASAQGDELFAQA